MKGPLIFLLELMKVWKVDCSKRLTSTKVYYRSGKNYITNWQISCFQLGQMLLQTGAALFYYKLRQVLWQIGAVFFTNWANVITNWGSFLFLQTGEQVYYKLEQHFSLQIRASVIADWGSLIITNQASFIKKWGSYYKLEQLLLQIGAIITNYP